jgi:hypothetical protein
MDWSVFPGRSLNDTSQIFLFPLSEPDPKELDVNCWISFHWEMGEQGFVRLFAADWDKGTFPQRLMGVHENAISNSVPQSLP